MTDEWGPPKQRRGDDPTRRVPSDPTRKVSGEHTRPVGPRRPTGERPPLTDKRLGNPTGLPDVTDPSKPPSGWSTTARVSKSAGRGAAKATVASARLIGKAGQGAGRTFRRYATAQGAGESGLDRVTEMHLSHTAGDAAMMLALAGTLFFNPSTAQARSSVAWFLFLTMVPFALVAPLIGPLLDKFSHGRRWAIGSTMAVRAFLCWVLAEAVTSGSTWLFPAALGVLVASRAYNITRASAVPRLLPPQLSLVNANSKISMAGVIGALLGGGLAAAALKFGPAWALRVAFVFFVIGTIQAIMLPAQVDSSVGELDPEDTGPIDPRDLVTGPFAPGRQDTQVIDTRHTRPLTPEDLRGGRTADGKRAMDFRPGGADRRDPRQNPRQDPRLDPYAEPERTAYRPDPHRIDQSGRDDARQEAMDKEAARTFRGNLKLRLKRRIEATPWTVRHALWSTGGTRILTAFLIMFMAFLTKEHPINGMRGELVLTIVVVATGIGQALGSALGNVIRDTHPERTAMLAVLAAILACIAVAIWYSIWTLFLVGLVQGLASQLAKLSFDALVQRDVGERVRTSVFAWSETMLQILWVFGGVLGIALPLNPHIGFPVAAAALTWTVVMAAKTKPRGRAARTAPGRA